MQNFDLENVANSRYLNIDEIQALKLHDKKKVSLFLPYKCMLIEQNFDDLEYLIKFTTKSFDIIA